MSAFPTKIEEILDGYQKRHFKPSEVIAHFLKKIETSDAKLNSFLQTDLQKSSERARSLDNEIDQSSRHPLFGIPIALKDNFLLRGWRATAGSKILEKYVSPYTGTAVAKLEAAGAVIVGKTNCDEFAMGSSNENSAFGPVKNPWDLSRVSGGSSGGSAAAVAAGFCAASLGTDTGGSIRQPASLCGVVGLKPSYGRVSRSGVMAFGSSLDQIGPFAQSVWSTAKVLEVMAGHDPLDATSSKREVPRYCNELASAKVGEISIGICRPWLEGVSDEVRKSFDDSVALLKQDGAKIIDIELPNISYSLSSYYLIAPCEASSNLARYDGVRYGYRADKVTSGEELYSRSRGEGFGPEVKLRIMLGAYALSAGYYDAFYLKANQARKKIQQDFEKAFEKCQCILSPTSPTTAFRIGERVDNPIKMYLSDIFTIPVNLAGLPAISVPCGLDSQSLPVGLQFIGKSFEEAALFKLAASYESSRGIFGEAKF